MEELIAKHLARLRQSPADEAPFHELEKLLEQAGRWDELIRLYENRVRTIPDSPNAVRCLARAAELWRTRLNNPARAEELFRQALATGADGGALDGLKLIYESRGDLLALVDVLERRASEQRGEEAAHTLVALGQALQRLNRQEQALKAFERAMNAAPELAAPVLGAVQQFVQLGRFEMALELLDESAEVLGAEAAGQYAAIAARLADEPLDHALALRAAESALALDSGSEAAARVQALVAGYRDGWRDRAKALRLEANEERDRKRMASLFLSVAMIHAVYDDEAEGTKKLKEFLDKALLLWPGMPAALAFLERLAAKKQDHKGLEAVLDRLSGEVKERGAAAEVCFRLSVVRGLHLGDRAGSLEALVRAAQLDPSRPELTAQAADGLAAEKRFADAAALLEKHAAALGDGRAQVPARLKLAQLFDAQLGDKQRARQQLEAALAADPWCVEAAERLVSFYEVNGDHARLAEALERTIPASRDDKEKSSRLEQLGELYGDKLSRPLDAVRVLSRALLLNPNKQSLRKALERHAAAANAWDDVVYAYRTATDLAGPKNARALMRRTAELLEQPLNRLDEAAEVFRALLAEEPGDEEVSKALEALLSRLGAHRELSAGLEARLQEAKSPREKLELLRKMAAALEQAGSDPQQAYGVYRQILELQPEDVEASKRLHAAASALEKWDEAAKAALRTSALLQGAEARDWQQMVAQLYAEKLERRDEAAELYLRLLREDPARQPVSAALERLAAGGIRARVIAEALAPVYRAAGEHGREANALQMQLAGMDEPARRLATLRELARLFEEKLADRRAAFGWLEQAFRLAPSDEQLGLELKRLAGELNAHAELAAFLSEVAGGVDAAQARALLLEAASLAEAGNEPELAMQALNRLLQGTPGDVEALESLYRLCLRADRLDECERVLRARIEAEPSRRAAHCAELARLAERRGRPQDAARALQDALAAGGDEEELLPKLAQLFEQAGDGHALKETLQRELQVAERKGDGDRQARVRLRLSRLMESTPGDRAAAVQNYAAILAQRPTDPEALAALQKMLQEPAHREAAARALIPAYEAAKEHRKLVHALEVLGEATDDAQEKIAVLRREAQIHAVELRQVTLAFTTLARAFRLAPQDPQLRIATRKAAEDAESLDTYAEVVEEAADAAPGSQAIPLLREVAEVSERKLGDRERAVALYRRIVELDPDNLDGLRGLHRLFRHQETWEQLAETCQRLASLVHDEQEKVQLFREAGSLFEGKLERAEDAASCFRALAEIDPLDRDAALALDRLYEALKRPQDLAFALELRRAQEGASPSGREVAFRLAELKHLQLNDAAGALQIHAQILAEEPSHNGARASLETWARSGGVGSLDALKLIDPVLERSGEHTRRISMREARLEGAPAEERAQLSAEIRRIYERDMGQPEMAFLQACRAFQEGVDREQAEPEMERLARETNSFDALADLYETAASASLPGDESGTRATRRAAQLRQQLGESEKAIGLWKDLLAEVPGDREALEALAKLHERTQNARELSDVYRQQAALTQDAGQRAQLLLQAGQAKLQLGDDEAAIELGRGVLALQPLSRPALELLDQAYARVKRGREHADVLRQLAELTEEGAARRALLLKRATLLEKEGDVAEAVDGYARVLAENPGEASAVAGLERLFERDQGRLEAARVLEPFYRSVNDARHLCEVLEVRAAQASPAERLQTLQEIARMRESLGQRPLAFATLLRCFREDPGGVALRDELERLAAETGAHDALAAAYEDELERVTDEELSLTLWRRLGAIYGDRLGLPDKSAQALEEVYRRAPGDETVLDALARIYRRANNLRELVDVLRRQAAVLAEPEKKRELLHEVAELCQSRLSDPAGAIAAWKEILSLDEDDAQALSTLAQMLGEVGRYEELAEIVSRQLEIARREQKVEQAFALEVRLGRIRLTRLADPRGALTLFTGVLQARPGHPDAVAALEEMARGEGALKAEAALALEPVFSQAGDDAKLVQMLEARAEASAPQEKAVLLRRIATLYAERLSSGAMAFLYAGRALAALPDDEESLLACLRHVDAAEAHEELAATLEELVEKARTDEARVRLRRTLARLCQEKLDEKEQALGEWRRVLELLPADREALESLAALFREEERWPDLLDTLRRQLASAETDAQRAALLLRVGELQDERLGEPGSAIATYRRLLELKPDDGEALERLDRLCLRTERWPELADTLAREIALAASKGHKEQQLTLEFRLAQVRESRLLDRSGAMALYRGILEVRKGHAETVERLEAIFAREPEYNEAADLLAESYRATGNQLKLAQLLDERAAASTDAASRKQYLMELARIRVQHQERSDLAFMTLCKAFREDPGDAELRRSLEKVTESAETHEELAALYEEELPRLDGEDAAQVCLKIAQLDEQRLGEPEQAIRFYERARTFHASASAIALPALERLYRDQEQWTELVEVLQALVAATAETSEKTTLLFRLGQLAAEKLDPPQPDLAAQAFEQILELDGAHLPAARELEKLYETARRFDRLVKILELQRQRASGQEKERLTARLAEVSVHGLGDVERSIALYREMLERNPRSDAAYLALEGLYEDTARLGELSELIGARLATTVDPREITRLSEKLGRVLEEMGRHEEAIAAFRAALERDPRHRRALEQLRNIYEAQGNGEELATVLRRLVPLQDDQRALKQVRLRLAEVLGGLGKREEAIESARRVLDLEPHVAEDLVRAEELFRSQAAWPDLVKAMELRAELCREEDDLEGAVAVLFGVAEVWRTTLDRKESAAPSYERVLELTPSNRVAFEALREVYASVNDWRRYAAVFDRHLPTVLEPAERVALLKDLGQVQEYRLGQKDIAFLTLCRAFGELPSDEEVWRDAHRLADETGSHEELASVYETLVDEVEKGPLAERLYLSLAMLHDKHLDQPEEAEAALRKVLEFDATNRAALDALAGMFARRGQDREYVVSLEQKLEAAATLEEKKGILRDIAQVQAGRLESPEDAAGAWLRSLELEPDRQTFHDLAELYRGQKEFVKVSEILMRARDFETDPELRSKLQAQVAEIYEREVGDDEAAIAGYRMALEFDPGNRDALYALERLYTKLDRPAELLGVYDAQLQLADVKERVRVLFKSAAIWENKYQHLENADACFEAVLAVDPVNLQAVKELERIRRVDAEAKRPATARWEDLLRAYERHLGLQPETAEQVELLVAMGEVHYRELKKIDKAARIFQRALDLNPSSREAMHALGLLYERSGNWPFALDMLSREAALLGTSDEAVELWHRIGKINEDMLLDAGSARASYQKALEIDEGYLPSIRALKGLFELEKDWDNYLRMLTQEAEQTRPIDERAKAFLEVAKFYQESREDRDSAAKHFEEALKLVPDSLEAARPLADIYMASEKWEGAEKMLEIVAQQLSAEAARDLNLARELCRQLYRLGYVCEKLRKTDRALWAYERAYGLDSTYLAAAEGYGNLLVASQRHADALPVYQAMLIHHREALTDLEVVELYWQLGDLYRKLGQHDRAQKEFERALATDSTHEPSLRAQLEMLDAQGRHEEAVEYRNRLLELLDGEAKFELLVDIGRIAKEKLSDAYQAIDAYVAALKVRGDSVEVLESLLQLYVETRQGQKAVDTLERLLALPQVQADAQRSKKLNFILAAVYRDEVKDVPKAVEALNRALDFDYKYVEAFAALESLLGQNRMWEALEQNYMRMIQRLPKSDDTHAVRMTLFRALGDLYDKVKKDTRAARQVYQVVAKGLPDDVGVLERYAELAASEEGAEAEAVVAVRNALQVTAAPQKMATNLVKLCARTRDYDGAWVAAQVVAHLVGEPGPDEREILSKLGPYARRKEQAQKPLTNHMWTTLLFHPKVRGPMGEILALLQERLGAHYAKKHAALGIEPKQHRVDPASSLELAINSYKYVLRILDMEALELYSPFLMHTREARKNKALAAQPAPDKELLLEPVHTWPVSLKAGGKLFSEQGQKELYFALARAMAWTRPELTLARVLPAERLEAVFQAAIVVGVPSYRVTADPRQVEVERKTIERLEPQFRATLARLARDYVKGSSTSDVRSFIEGAELTAMRAGALLAADVEVAKNAISRETGSKVPLRSRIRDLMLFCLSPEYAELREALGLKIEIKLPGAK